MPARAACGLCADPAVARREYNIQHRTPGVSRQRIATNVVKPCAPERERFATASFTSTSAAEREPHADALRQCDNIRLDPGLSHRQANSLPVQPHARLYPVHPEHQPVLSHTARRSRMNCRFAGRNAIPSPWIKFHNGCRLSQPNALRTAFMLLNGTVVELLQRRAEALFRGISRCWCAATCRACGCGTRPRNGMMR